MIGALLPGNVLEPLSGDREQVNFDPSQVQLSRERRQRRVSLLMRADAPVKSFRDVFSNEAILGATGDGGSNKGFPAC